MNIDMTMLLNDGRESLPVNSGSMIAPGGPVYQKADSYHAL